MVIHLGPHGHDPAGKLASISRMSSVGSKAAAKLADTITVPRRKTYAPRASEISRTWFVVDAEGLVLGRMCTEVARILRGKHKPMFAPNMDTGDHVIVINAGKIHMTGKKVRDRLVYRHSGYPGGLSKEPYAKLLQRNPRAAIGRSVSGMLPKGPLGRQMIKKLRVYEGNEHPHSAQSPIRLDLRHSASGGSRQDETKSFGDIQQREGQRLETRSGDIEVNTPISVIRRELDADGLLNLVGGPSTTVSWSTDLDSPMCFLRLIAAVGRHDKADVGDTILGGKARLIVDTGESDFIDSDADLASGSPELIARLHGMIDLKLVRLEFPGVAWVWQAVSPLTQNRSCRTFGVVAVAPSEHLIVEMLRETGTKFAQVELDSVRSFLAKQHGERS
jgi:large subunit ribosomal protein L13